LLDFIQQAWSVLLCKYWTIPLGSANRTLIALLPYLDHGIDDTDFHTPVLLTGFRARRFYARTGSVIETFALHGFHRIALQAGHRTNGDICYMPPTAIRISRRPARRRCRTTEVKMSRQAALLGFAHFTPLWGMSGITLVLDK
jgi:hypothetical protein